MEFPAKSSKIIAKFAKKKDNNSSLEIPVVRAGAVELQYNIIAQFFTFHLLCSQFLGQGAKNQLNLSIRLVNTTLVTR